MPDTIHQYEPLWGSWYVDTMLGAGSFGKVYRVRKEEFGQTHYSAVKIITVPQSEQELKQLLQEGFDEASAKSYFHSFVADILQEIRLMSEFQGNSNIVSFHDYKVVEKQDAIGWDILIRMELLTSLPEWLQEHAMTQRDVITMGIHICRALELCAQKNTIHRDIKPDNIFVSSFEEYKPGDFGVARQIERTMSGLSKKGTYTYMAPEVYRGDEYNTTVDLYSLGIVMYRLLNQNRPPFSPPFPQPITLRDREEALMRRMKGEAIPPISGIDPVLNAVVLKACAFDRKKRYRDAREMNEALETVLQSKGLQPGKDKPVTARQSGKEERSGRLGNQSLSDAPQPEMSVTMPLKQDDKLPLMRDAGPSPKKMKQAKRNKKNRGLIPLIVALSVLLVGIVTVGGLWLGGVIDPGGRTAAVVAAMPTPSPTPTSAPTATSATAATPTLTPTFTSAPTPTLTPTPTPTPRPTFTPTPKPTPTAASTPPITPAAMATPLVMLPSLAEIGDRLTFGNYHGEAIQWQVLAVEEGRALVISAMILDAKPFYTSLNKVTWETSTLRAWLNNDFYKAAFTESEQAFIGESVVKISKSATTQDMIFLLSKEEAREYFANDDERKAEATPYAEQQGRAASKSGFGHAATSGWWLRSAGTINASNEYVAYNGCIHSNGYPVNFGQVGVRPSLWLNLPTDQSQSETPMPERIASPAGDFTIEDGILTGYTGPGGDVVIPDGVTGIGESVFEDCASLTGITLPDSLIAIESRAFCGCEALKQINLPDSLTSIGDAAFLYCSALTQITLPDSLISIGEGAFFGCFSLEQITVPASIAYIGTEAFNNTALSSIDVAPDNSNYTSIDGVLFDKEAKILHTYLSSKIDNSYAVPNGCSSIGEYAFSVNFTLTQVTLPDSLISIGDGAFFECDALTQITLPDSVISIGKWAFADCDALVQVTIPAGVTDISENAFADSPNLTIHGQPGSYAESYAKVNNIPFVTTVITGDSYYIMKAKKSGLRSETSTDSEIMVTISTGAIVSAVEKISIGTGEWIYAAYNGQCGFLPMSDVTFYDTQKEYEWKDFLSIATSAVKAQPEGEVVVPGPTYVTAHQSQSEILNVPKNVTLVLQGGVFESMHLGSGTIMLRNVTVQAMNEGGIFIGKTSSPTNLVLVLDEGTKVSHNGESGYHTAYGTKYGSAIFVHGNPNKKNITIINHGTIHSDAHYGIEIGDHYGVSSKDNVEVIVSNTGSIYGLFRGVSIGSWGKGKMDATVINSGEITTRESSSEWAVYMFSDSGDGTASVHFENTETGVVNGDTTIRLLRNGKRLNPDQSTIVNAGKMEGLTIDVSIEDNPSITVQNTGTIGTDISFALIQKYEKISELLSKEEMVTMAKDWLVNMGFAHMPKDTRVNVKLGAYTWNSKSGWSELIHSYASRSVVHSEYFYSESFQE